MTTFKVPTTRLHGLADPPTERDISVMAATYPNGYAGSPQGMGDMRTIEAVAARTTVQRLHPEMWRRVRAMMIYANSKGVPLGVGTGWRVQPTNPDGSCKAGFACPGNSYHEGFMPGGTTKPDGVHDTNAMACDMVPDVAWGWMGANCHLFGLIDFSDVNSEAWHIQPYEIPRSRNKATAMPPITTFQLPTAPGGPFVTDQDKIDLIAILKAVVPGLVAATPIPTPWTATGTTPLNSVLHYVLRNSGTIYNSPSGGPDNGAVANDVDAILAIMQGLSVEAITEAVKTAIEANPVSAELDDEQIAAIADAVVTETAQRLAE
jgi:hypothetical protein